MFSRRVALVKHLTDQPTLVCNSMYLPTMEGKLKPDIEHSISVAVAQLELALYCAPK